MKNLLQNQERVLSNIRDFEILESAGSRFSDIKFP